MKEIENNSYKLKEKQTKINNNKKMDANIFDCRIAILDGVFRNDAERQNPFSMETKCVVVVL